MARPAGARQAAVRFACPPLGCDIDSRKLVVNAAEAKTVNLIFRRYLDLGCVRALRDDLADRRITSKAWAALLLLCEPPCGRTVEQSHFARAGGGNRGLAGGDPAPVEIVECRSGSFGRSSVARSAR
jgi:hypothetical protein